MRHVIQDLRIEHASMERLLRILETQTEAFQAGGKSDLAIVQDILLFFLDFPDQCHHPKEDLLAQKLLELSPARAEPLRDLIRQHKELGLATQRAAATMRSVRDEGEFSRDEAARTVREFIDAQRHHMEMEEIHFLPLADELLGDEELKALDAEIFRIEDPLFGREVEEHFQMLRDYIVKWERTHGAD